MASPQEKLMALPYALYFVYNINGFTWVAVSCDLPPTWTTKQSYSPPYRDLPGSAVNNITTGSGNVIAAMDITGAPPASATLITATLAASSQSLSDDVSHTAFRQDQPHEEDWLVFTDSLGRVCGEFSKLEWDAWGNTAPLNFMPSAPITAPH
jgi:hypothetical protein